MIEKNKPIRLIELFAGIGSQANIASQGGFEKFAEWGLV